MFILYIYYNYITRERAHISFAKLHILLLIFNLFVIIFIIYVDVFFFFLILFNPETNKKIVHTFFLKASVFTLYLFNFDCLFETLFFFPLFLAAID